MRTVAPRLIVGSIAAGLLLSGCGGSPEPSPLPKPTETVSPSASAAPVPPEMPAAAEAETDAAVEAFARHYVDIINFATSTGDTRELDLLAAKNCASCRRLSDRLEDIYRGGGSIKSDGWRVISAITVPDQPLHRKYIDVAIRQSPQVLVEKAGSSPKTFPGGKQVITMLIARHDEDWRITRMSLAG